MDFVLKLYLENVTMGFIKDPFSPARNSLNVLLRNALHFWICG